MGYLQKKMKYKVLCTSRSFGREYKDPLDLLKDNGCEIIMSQFSRQLTEDELVPIVKGIDGIIVGDDEVSAKVIEASDVLKVISKHGVGVDNIDIASAKAKGIVVTNTPGVNADAVADLMFGMIICLARRIIESDKITKSGEWQRICGVSVWNKTIGILGLGRIGKGVALRAKGFNMKILGYDIIEDKDFNKMHSVIFCGIDEILTEADFVVITCNLTEDTKGMIGEKEFRLMKNTAYLINTSRAEIVNQNALLNALREKKIAGAGIDVYEKEPPIDDPLLKLGNVITTSHIGAYTKEAMKKMGDIAAQNTLDVLMKGKCEFSL